MQLPAAFPVSCVCLCPLCTSCSGGKNRDGKSPEGSHGLTELLLHKERTENRAKTLSAETGQKEWDGERKNKGKRNEKEIKIVALKARLWRKGSGSQTQIQRWEKDRKPFCGSVVSALWSD